MNLSGVIRDPSLRQRLTLLAAAAGWRAALCSTVAELERALAEPGAAPDLLVSDDPAVLESCAEAPCPRVLMAPTTADLPGAHFSRVSSEQPDETLAQALKTCVNARRFRERFAELERREPITSLPRHEELFASLARHQGRPMGLLVIQIDHAAHLYDHLDPVSKTDLLTAMGGHLQAAVPPGGLLGFYDAGCFAVALPDADEAGLAGHADSLVHRVRDPLRYRGGELHVTASVGWGFEAHYGDPASLWSEAWSAMRRALEGGGDRASGPEAGHLSRRLPRALERDEFSLVLQPQLDVAGRRLTGVEALLRWQGMEVGELAPNRFIPVAERRGHMARIGDWVLDRACREAAGWLEHLIEPLVLGINVSPQQFHQDVIVGRIAHWRSERWFDPGMLELELPQEALLTLVDDHRAALYRLRDWGVRFALDNLGSGLIDPGRLLRCPADTLKIDRALVGRLDGDPDARDLVARICELGRRFELRVVAVGVERPSELAILAELGCSDVQGYLLSPPLSPAEFHTWLRAGSPDPHARLGNSDGG